LEKKSKTPSTCEIHHTPRLTLITPLAYGLRKAKMDVPRLPERQDFLANGLEPVEDNGEECHICYEPKTDPVTVGCDGRHDYCRECIVRWLGTLDIGRCPSCRQPLFANDPANLVALEEEEARVARRLRRALVEHVFWEIELDGCLIGNPPSANVIRARKFHKDIQWSNGRVIKSSLAARDWLVHLRDALEDGGQTINVEDAGSSLIG
jgi:hypothetical protein